MVLKYMLKGSYGYNKEKMRMRGHDNAPGSNEMSDRVMRQICDELFAMTGSTELNKI